jgi:hypothetical protein
MFLCGLSKTSSDVMSAQKTVSYEEVKIVNRGGKKFWVCPHCAFETPFIEKKAPHVKKIEEGT